MSDEVKKWKTVLIVDDIKMNGFIIKPVQEKVLLEKVSQCFEYKKRG